MKGETMDQAATPPSIEATSRTTDSAIAIAAIAVLIVSYAVNAMDRTLFPLMLTDVRREYDFNLPQAGLMSTIFTLGMTLAGFPTGYLMSRYSRKTVIQVGILIYSAATVITVTAIGFADMLFYRAVTGIGEAMQLTALLAVFSSYFSRHRAAGVGLLNYAYAGGAAVGPWLGARLLVDYGTWRAPMIIYGVIGLAMMVLIAAVVRPYLSETNTAGAENTAIAAGGAASLNNRNTIVLAILSILFGLALYGYLGMYPTFLREQLHYAPFGRRPRHEHLRARRAGVAVYRMARRPLLAAAGAGPEFSARERHRGPFVQRPVRLRNASSAILHARRDLQRHHLRQPRRLSRQVGGGVPLGARLRPVRLLRLWLGNRSQAMSSAGSSG